jgi:hypothetical protein
LPSERRNAAAAARASLGVSTSRHQHPGAGRRPTAAGLGQASRGTGQVWSLSAAACRWQPNTSG